MRFSTRSSTTARLSLLSLVCVAALGCTNQKLVPVKENLPQNVDDLVDITATFCTRPTENVVFPVKLLLVVDTSGSMQFTDQPNLRVNAIRQLMNALRTQDDVFVATIGFGSNIYVDPLVLNPGDRLFLPVAEWVEPQFISIKDVTTDYHGALAATKNHMLRDMLQSDAAELARTKYVVLFFSDGSPSPRCCATAEESVGAFGNDPFNCPLEGWESALLASSPNTRFCENEEENTFCNDEDDLDFFRDQLAAPTGDQPNYGDGTLAALNDLELNSNYNRTYQIQELTKDIMELGETFDVGKIEINTALLFDSALPDLVKQIFRLNKCRSASLLESMAEIGNGQFRDFESAEEIDFLSFNFTSLRQGFTVLSTFVINQNALPPPSDGTSIDYLPDSDGDGLDDEAEFELGTDAVVADSDKFIDPPAPNVVPNPLDAAAWGDGYDDHFEGDRIAIGFDPRFQAFPLTPCPLVSADRRDQADTDADGLNGCEEDVLDTNPQIADTDFDGLPDGVEVRYGLNPLVHEQNTDSDFDGTPNLEEVRKGRDPFIPDDDRDATSVRYELVETGTTDDGRTCYESTMRGVHLASTQPRTIGAPRGFNDMFIYIAEVPQDNPTGRVEYRVACLRAQYIKPTFKNPANGTLEITEDQFFDLSQNPGSLIDPNDPVGGKLADICNNMRDR